MCWNQYVSLNTFIFSVFVLLLIAYNNEYTQYKTPIFDNKFFYFLFLSFITMQLIEFFLWKYINNKKINNIFSMLGSLLLIIQPIASLLLLKNETLRYSLIIPYSICALLFFIYEINNHSFYTTVSKTGHLLWKWNDMSGYKILLYFIWMILLFLSLFINKHYGPVLYLILLLAISYYSYDKDGSAGSLWCWSINSVMLYYAFNLLIVLPFKEHGIC
jgi:hypothetical protein